MSRVEKFYRVVGGRKQLNGAIYAVLITVMVFPLKGSFETYAMALAGALLGTSYMVAMEDRHTKGAREFPRRRLDDLDAPRVPEL